MKKIALILSMALALTACSGGSEAPKADNSASESAQTASSSAPTPQTQEKKAEHYVVGTDSEMPPFTFKDEMGQMTGFDVEVLRAIADDQNFSMDFIPTKRSELFNELEAGHYQILVANLGINPERLSKSEMSKPYVWAPNALMGKVGGAGAKTLEEIGDGTVAIQEGSWSHDVVTKAGIKNIKPVASLYAAYAELMRGNVDYVVGDAGALNYHHLSNPKAQEMPVYVSVYAKGVDASVAFAVTKGNTTLIEKINTGLANVRASGKYDEIYKKYFGDDQSLKVPAEKLK